MKKIFLASAIIAASSFAAFAQSGKQNFNPAGFSAVYVKEPAVNFSDRNNRKIVNSRAVRDFAKTFKDVVNENWYSTGNGFIAKFMLNGIQTRVDYDNRGNWLATFRYYNETHLSPAIRHLIRSNYYDFKINLVTEVAVADKTAYIVSLEGERAFKKIKVVDDEMEETEHLEKSF
ncbi:MAG: hypothetical protein SFU87_01130 [Chitinophagaceae bacterium]|nr:hypothetical protein [Chitinophagaceae bacterium]